MTGCVICKKYEYIEEDSLSGFPGANSGWTCSVREIEDFKTFPCKRKLKCFEEIKEMSKARDEYYSLFESERVFTEVQNYVKELEQEKAELIEFIKDLYFSELNDNDTTELTTRQVICLTTLYKKHIGE